MHKCERYTRANMCLIVQSYITLLVNISIWYIVINILHTYIVDEGMELLRWCSQEMRGTYNILVEHLLLNTISVFWNYTDKSREFCVVIYCLRLVMFIFIPVYRISQEKCSQKLPKVAGHLAVSPGFSYVKQCETKFGTT